LSIKSDLKRFHPKSILEALGFNFRFSLARYFLVMVIFVLLLAGILVSFRQAFILFTIKVVPFHILTLSRLLVVFLYRRENRLWIRRRRIGDSCISKWRCPREGIFLSCRHGLKKPSMPKQRFRRCFRYGIRGKELKQPRLERICLHCYNILYAK